MSYPWRSHVKTAVVLLIVQITASQSAKTSARPVHEVINEQARIDDKRIQTSPGLLPYGNPLAGNSQQNAKLHAQNQQAMFNAERVRQHRAQLMRWNKANQHTDSYMRAYHESQENHQLALERQQANLREVKPAPTTVRTVQRQRQKLIATTVRSAQRQGNLKRAKGPDPAKIMNEETILKEKSRNHRSYGSVEYHRQLIPRRYKTIYLTPGTTYDQGVTIKPNGNVGIASHEAREEETNQLYTQAVPSRTQYVYPKQYSQMQHYESAHDIAALNALLKKEPQDQLTELNALIHSGEHSEESSKELNTPVDLYFYLKDPKLAQYYAQSMYGHGPQTHLSYAQAYMPHIREPTPQSEVSHNYLNYASAYLPEVKDNAPTLAPQNHLSYASAYMPQIKDHTPISEEIDDVEDPNQITRRPLTNQLISTKLPEDVTAPSVGPYFTPEDQAVTSRPEYFYKEHRPAYSALKYEKPLTFYNQDISVEDSREGILNHGQYTGVQHLNQDGTGVSAYGDDNVSMINRMKRSPVANLDTSPFLVPNRTIVKVKNSTTTDTNETLSQAEALRGYRIKFKNDHLPFSKHQFQIDHSMYDSYNDEDEDSYDEEEYNLDYEEPDFKYGAPNYKQSNLFKMREPASVDNHPSETHHSYSSSYYPYHRNPSFQSSYHKPSDFSTSYGVPHQIYNVPDEYGVPSPPPDISSVVDSLEPVYMLTKSQLNSLIGHHNTNIQHLDVFQWQPKPKSRPKRPHYIRKKKKTHRPVPRHIKKNLYKLHKHGIL